MNIRSRKELKDFATRRVSDSQYLPQVVLIYCAVVLGLSGLNTLISYLLDLQISRLSGLSNMSSRTMFSTLQSMLPIAASLITMCMEIGYLAAILRTARGQYTSVQTLRLGFDRFWVMLRCSIFKGLILSGLLFLSIYLGIMIFMISPFSNAAVEILMPYLEEMTILDSQLVLDDAVYSQFASAIVPAYLICGILFCVVALPTVYSYRMVNYVIIDKPALGALAALRESKQMMRGNRIALLKLDASLWWYYGLSLLATVVCYGDGILPMLGISLPGHADIWYFVFFVLYLAVTFLLYYFLRSRLEVTYALAYDSLKPAESKDNGVILGNIFQM